MVATLDEYLTTAQVARRLGVTPARVIQLARRGQLAHHRSPHGRLFDPVDVRRLAEERANRSAATPDRAA